MSTEFQVAQSSFFERNRVVKKGFDFIYADDPEYKDLIAEIYFDGEFVALVSQEAGFNLLDIQLLSRKSGKPWHFKVNEFEGALEKVKRRLWELRKNAEGDEPHP